MTPIEQRNKLEKLEYDFFPNKQDNGMYKVDVYKRDEFIRTGSVEYKCWHVAIQKTIKIFYEKFCS